MHVDDFTGEQAPEETTPTSTAWDMFPQDITFVTIVRKDTDTKMSYRVNRQGIDAWAAGQVVLSAQEKSGLFKGLAFLQATGVYPYKSLKENKTGSRHHERLAEVFDRIVMKGMTTITVNGVEIPFEFIVH